MNPTALCFATHSYAYLGQELSAALGRRAGRIERKLFLDGERYHRILDEVAEADVLLVGGTIGEEDTLEVYDLACGLVHGGARTLTLVIPYLGYSTMDRAVKTGEVVKAKTRARLLSSIPSATAGNRIVLCDLHAEGLQHYFEGSAHPFHVYARSLILDAARELGGTDFVMACTDAGRAKWVESLGYDLGVPVSFVFKRRADDGRPTVAAVSAQVDGKNVVIYDDMIRSGQSLLNAVEAYRAAGAQRISAVTTHGIFPGDSLDKIRATGLLDRIICTNTHPHAVELAERHAGYLEVRSITPVLERFLTSGYRALPAPEAR